MYSNEDREFTKDIRRADPEGFAAYRNFADAIMHSPDSPLDARVTELIALGVAFTTQCPHCIKGHTEGARKAGVSKEELARVTHIAAAMRAGGAETHGLMAFKYYEEA